MNWDGDKLGSRVADEALCDLLLRVDLSENYHIVKC